MSLLPYSLPPPGPFPTPSSREVGWGGVPSSLCQWLPGLTV